MEHGAWGMSMGHELAFKYLEQVGAFIEVVNIRYSVSQRRPQVPHLSPSAFALELGSGLGIGLVWERLQCWSGGAGHPRAHTAAFTSVDVNLDFVAMFAMILHSSSPLRCSSSQLGPFRHRKELASKSLSNQ